MGRGVAIARALRGSTRGSTKGVVGVLRQDCPWVWVASAVGFWRFACARCSLAGYVPVWCCAFPSPSFSI